MTFRILTHAPSQHACGHCKQRRQQATTPAAAPQAAQTEEMREQETKRKQEEAKRKQEEEKREQEAKRKQEKKKRNGKGWTCGQCGIAWLPASAAPTPGVLAVLAHF